VTDVWGCYFFLWENPLRRKKEYKCSEEEIICTLLRLRKIIQKPGRSWKKPALLLTG
jgi:hypothetical protein